MTKHKNEERIEQAIQAAAATAPRITPPMIDALMKRVEVRLHYDGTSTFANAFLDGKFYLASGHSACVSLENYRKDIGDEIATGKAFEAVRQKLWEIEGYRLYMQLNQDNSK